MRSSNVDPNYRTITSEKPWCWYYDRLPVSLRKALAEATFNWSDMQAYKLWKGAKGYPKTPIPEIIEIIRENEASRAYDWMKDD